MATNNVPTHNKRTIAMDMFPPFAVYVDGKLVAEHATEASADILYAQLRVTHLSQLPSTL